MTEILLLKIAIVGLSIACIMLLFDWVRLKKLENNNKRRHDNR